MRCVSFLKIKESIVHWIMCNEQLKNNNIPLEVLNNDEKVFRIILTFGECLAEIRLQETDYAPFNLVCFEMIDIENSIVSMVHSWYDDEFSTLEDIKIGLNQSICIALGHCIKRNAQNIP